ncbi:MAG TPA: YIP1 family protein [Methanomethylovorans sp.]|nr:YIP1 family protein [Methanomethylovorans sp.]
MLEVLSDPSGFFEEKIKEKIDFKPPYAVIGTVTLLTLINAFILMRELMENLLNDVPTIIQLIVITLGLMVTMASGMIVWLMISGLFYVFSWLLAGQGKFTRVLEFVAYGFLPFIFSSAISMVLMISMCSFSDFAMNGPQAIEKAMLKSPYMIVSNAISIILALWSANIWVFAMIHSRDLSIKNAMITVGIPIGVYLIYMLYTLYQALG